MLTTGNQLRAARALVDMDQSTLAGRAGVNINTIGSMEKRGAEVLTSGYDKIRAVMTVLEAAGVEFLNHGQPGVRLRPRASDHPKPVGSATGAFELLEDTVAQDRGKPPRGRGKRLASIKETGEELPQEQWEQFERADKKPTS